MFVSLFAFVASLRIAKCMTYYKYYNNKVCPTALYDCKNTKVFCMLLQRQVFNCPFGLILLCLYRPPAFCSAVYVSFRALAADFSSPRVFCRGRPRHLQITLAVLCALQYVQAGRPAAIRFRCGPLFLITVCSNGWS